MVGGLSGQRMLIGLLIGIIVLVVLVLKTKIHAFLALIMSAVIIGLVGGMPMVNVTLENGKTLGIINSITTGFGGTLGSIGIIIGFGVMMGQIFEKTGAAKRMAQTFLKLFGKGREEEALGITGFLVSIPIFCDSGFVILAPIAKAISKVTKKSVISLGVALAAGLVITHTLVPPTPGPLGVCGIFGVDVGKFILFGIVIAIPMAIACTIYARWVGKKIYQIPNDDEGFDRLPYQEPDYSTDFTTNFSGLPSTLESFAPLVLPIILILISTVSSALGLTTGFMQIFQFLGSPIVAVGLGLVVAIVTLGRNLTREEAIKEMEKGMASAGIIMLVTGGGGAGPDYQGQRTRYIYGRRPCRNGGSDRSSSVHHFHGNEIYPGFRYGSHDDSGQHLRSDHPCSRCESDPGRAGMLRGLLILQLFQRQLFLGCKQNSGRRRGKGPDHDVFHHVNDCVGGRIY